MLWTIKRHTGSRWDSGITLYLERISSRGLERPELLDKIVEGHKRYFETIEPDMMKLMNEGFMGYPPVMNNNLETAEDLLPSRASAPDHPWITEQVKHVRRLVDLFGDKVMTFYNVFAPLQVIRIRLDFYDLEI